MTAEPPHNNDILSKIPNAGLAWHYTIGLKFEQIIADGFLRPTDSYIEENEKPILWFSTNQFWERTANKACKSPFGELRSLTMEETSIRGGGLFRFGIPVKKLTRWPELGKLANMKSSIQKRLNKSGIKQGSNPKEWCGTLEIIQTNECRIQKMEAGGKWVDEYRENILVGFLDYTEAT